MAGPFTVECNTNNVEVGSSDDNNSCAMDKNVGVGSPHAKIAGSSNVMHEQEASVDNLQNSVHDHESNVYNINQRARLLAPLASQSLPTLTHQNEAHDQRYSVPLFDRLTPRFSLDSSESFEVLENPPTVEGNRECFRSNVMMLNDLRQLDPSIPALRLRLSHPSNRNEGIQSDPNSFGGGNRVGSSSSGNVGVSQASKSILKSNKVWRKYRSRKLQLLTRSKPVFWGQCK